MVEFATTERFRVDIRPLWSTITPPPPPPVVEALFKAEGRTFASDGRGGIVETKTREYYMGIDPLARETGRFNKCTLPTGLASGLISELHLLGHKVEVIDHRQYGDRLKGDRKVLQAAMLDDETVLKAVRRHPMGQIEVDDLNQAAEMIALILSYYPHARALVPVASRNLADKFYGALRREGVVVSKQVTVHKLKKKCGCTILTFRRLNAVLPGDWDLVLLPDPQSATRDTSAGPLGHAISKSGAGRYIEDGELEDRGVRVYSFVGRDWQPDRRQKLQLEAISGQRIVVNRPRKAGVQCRWLTTPSCPRIHADNALECKQQAYWHNARRNQFIAGVARAFQHGDSRKLKKYGIRFHGEEPQLRGGQNPEVAVLVESTAHAKALKQLLPDWDVWQRTGDVPAPENDQIPKSGIITVTAAQQYGLQPDVLIVASGDPAQIQIPKFPPRIRHADDRDVLLVDFIDGFDDQVRRNSEARERNCRRRGWTIMEENRNSRQTQARQV